MYCISLSGIRRTYRRRIDANLMNKKIYTNYQRKCLMIKSQVLSNSSGKLIVNEYPTASANSNHFRGLIKELAIKKSLNQILCLLTISISVHHVEVYWGENEIKEKFRKVDAEEPRGLEIETNVPIMSATTFLWSRQLNLDFKDMKKYCLDYTEKGATFSVKKSNKGGYQSPLYADGNVPESMIEQKLH